LADFRRPGVELVRQAFRIVAVAGELRFKVVDLARQHTLDGCGIDRFHAGLEPGFERADEMAADLERGLELGSEQDAISTICRAAADTRKA
jgi:hypothetical protein